MLLGIDIYCKGCVLNNGKNNAVAAWGAVLTANYDDNSLKSKRYSGLVDPICSTNNYAEIIAACEAMRKIKDEYRNIPLKIYSSCNYMVGVINNGWNNSKNMAAFEMLQSEINKFRPSISFE